MKAIISLLSSHLTSLPVLAGTLATFALYRVLGKHIDEIYTKLRKGKSHEQLISSLRESLIDEKQRADECRRMAERYISLAHCNQWELIKAKREISKLKRALGAAGHKRTRRGGS